MLVVVVVFVVLLPVPQEELLTGSKDAELVVADNRR
jgi:hypothetical protein